MDSLGFAEQMNALISQGKPFVTATVVKTEGSALAKPGFKVLIHGNQVMYGTLGGACPESVIIDAADQVMKSGIPKTIRIHLEEAEKGLDTIISRKDQDEIFVETFCGGTIDVFLEPYRALERLIIIGQGGKDDVEDNLVGLGKRADFNVTVVDHAPLLTEEPDRIIQDLDFDLGSLDLTDRDYVVVLTKGERDITTLRSLEKASLAYLGLMASRKRVDRDLGELRKSGVTEKFLSSIHAPIGIDLKAVTPAEIAISIMAEIISVRRSKFTDVSQHEGQKAPQEAAFS